ncbi:MAG TPA: MBL fold metallo-hydrolase [Bryobacteraceae bacterium]|nr:MBL fold metallo-hydrolase [Bryobacteraceae bacterium]
MLTSRVVVTGLLMGAVAIAQTTDGAAAHRNAALALVDSNNRGVAHLACPAEAAINAAGAPAAQGFSGAGRGGSGRGGRGPAGGPPRAQWYQEPQQVFDNLYYLGTKDHTSWGVTTSAGIILIDTLFSYATKDEIEDGLRTLHLDPANIKILIVTHAHGDHDGGVKYIQDTFRPKVIMGAKDWASAAREANPPRHDIDATDGQKVTLGDTTITIYVTPGHTASTLSLLVPVKDHGEPHLAMEWGGTALSVRTSKEMLQSYISNAGRFLDIAQGAGADVIIGNHTEYNDAIAKLQQLKARLPGDPHVWVIGKEGVRKYLTVAQQCGKAYQALAEGRP